MTWTRRKFGGFAGASLVAALDARPTRSQTKARVVVIGGGIGGATVAKYLVTTSTKLDVTFEPDLEIEAHAHQGIEPDQHHDLPDIGAGHDREEHEKQHPTCDLCRLRVRVLCGGKSRRPPLDRSAQRLRPEVCREGRHHEDRDGTLGREAFPGVDRIAQGTDEVAELHHDLDEFLEDAEEDDEGEADEDGSTEGRGGQGKRGAEHAECCSGGGQDDGSERQAEPEGEGLEEGRRKCDEDHAQVEKLYRRHQGGEEAAGDDAGDSTLECQRGEGADAAALGHGGTGTEPDREQGRMAERHHADHDPARVDHRQNADDGDIDGDGAENEPQGHRPLERERRLARAAGCGIGRRGRHAYARFFAMRSPRMP